MTKSKTTRWYKLDRTADIYPMSTTRTFQSNFRVAVKLHDYVDEEVLEVAINKALTRFPSFKVQLRRGVFRYFLEKNNAKVKVFKDNGVDFEPIDYLQNNRFLFKVKTFKNNITMDIFHGLTDALGAFEFLKTILLVYHQELGVDIEDFSNVKHLGEEAPAEEYSDDVLKYYKKFKLSDKVIKTMIGKNCFQIKGKSFYSPGFAIVMGVIDAKKTLNIARAKGLTITELMGGVLLMSIKESFKNPKNKPIVAMIPINLRNIFPSKTVHNFTTLVRCEIDPLKVNPTIEDYAKEVSRQLKDGISNKELLQAQLSLSALLSQNPIAKWLPVALKTLFVKLPRKLSVGTKQTIIMSNVGVVRMPQEVSEKIAMISANINVSPKTPISCGISTHGDVMTINFTRRLKKSNLELAFFNNLKKVGIEAEIYANDRVEHLMRKAAKKETRDL